MSNLKFINTDFFIMKNIFKPLLILLLLNACVSDVEIPEEEPKKEKQITVAFNIKNDATNIATTQKIIITLSEKVFFKNGDALKTNNVEDIISLQLGNTKINYTVEINENRTIITLTANLNYDTKYTLIFNGNKLKGTNTQKVDSKTILFTTAKNNAPLSITDPLYKYQWYLKNTGQTGAIPEIHFELKPSWKTKGIDINLESVWKQGYTGKGMHIAILDEPLSLKNNEQHEDLKNTVNYAKSHNFYPFLQNDGNHGLGVAGIIAARANNIGIRGIAYESQMYTYGMLNPTGGNSEDQHTIDAMKKINQIPEISVVNNSWGSNSTEYEPDYLQTLEKGIQDGFGGKGIVHVKSGGNEGFNLNSTAYAENNFHGFILVTSVNYQGKNTDFSAYNYMLTNKTPPEVIGSIMSFGYSASVTGSNLWISAPGLAILTTGGWDNDTYKYNPQFSATSSAAPIITGVVALIRQANPNLTWRDVKLILAESATKNDASHSGWQQGYHKKSQPTEYFHFSNNYGFGLVHAEKAIELAKTWTNLSTMKTKNFSSASLDIAINGTFKENTITVQNSGIQFIESVVVELELDKTPSIDGTGQFHLKLHHDGRESVLNTRIFWFQSRGYSYQGL